MAEAAETSPQSSGSSPEEEREKKHVSAEEAPLVGFPRAGGSPPTRRRLHVHFIYSSVRPSGTELLTGGGGGGGGRLSVKTGWLGGGRCLPLDSGRLLFLAKAAIITRATSNKIVQARLGN